VLFYTYIVFLVNGIEGNGYSIHIVLELQRNFSLLLVTVCNIAQEDAEGSYCLYRITLLYPVYIIITVACIS